MVSRTILVSRAMRAQRRVVTALAMIANPRPPSDRITPMVSRTTQSSTNGPRLRKPPVMSKPALLKAEIEWKMPHQMPIGCHGGPASGPAMKAMDRMIAPATSTTIVKIAMRFRTVVTVPSSRPPSDSWTTRRSRSVVRRPRNNMSRRVEPAMMPKPPIWMSRRITTWPNGLQ